MILSPLTSPVPPVRQRRRGGFSLVELLTVMAIVAMVMVMMVNSMGTSGKSLESAGSRLVGLLSMARGQAVSRNLVTLVVLSTDSPAKGGMRALTIYEIAPRSDGAAPTAADWRQVHPWEVLPEGVLIDDSTFETAAHAPALPLPEVRFRDETVGSFRYLLFSPDGSLPQGQTAHLRVVEGFAEGGTPVYTHPTDQGDPANIYEISVLVTGVTKINRS